MIRLGLRENAAQFSLLVLVNAFVGAMVGMERSILPPMAEAEFGLRARAAVLSFIVVFGVSKAGTNYLAGRLSDRFSRKGVLVAGWLAGLVMRGSGYGMVGDIVMGLIGALIGGFVVGFFDLIPLVGATLGAIVVAIATVTVDFPVATLVWIGFIIVWQRFEDYVVQPAVYGRALHVNPIVTIVAVLAGAALLGILGALIAIPTAAAVQIILTEWWSSRSRRRARRVDSEPSAPQRASTQAA